MSDVSLRSMTAFASLSGEHGPFAWAWELRAVNGKGLDLRLRIPDWVPGAEAALRTALTNSLARGNVQGGLRVSRSDQSGPMTIDLGALKSVLSAIHQIEEHAQMSGVALTATSAADLLTMKAITDSGGDGSQEAEMARHAIAAIPSLIAAFVQMRATEGAALHAVLTGQLDHIGGLVERAAALLPDREAAMRDQVTDGLRRILPQAVDMDEGRLAQELAQIAIKADVTEEIDRLRAHVAAARTLLEAEGPVGRKLDFLAQEFNREANTLCSKSGSAALTEIGLDLKVTIDQMREQIQNVE